MKTDFENMNSEQLREYVKNLQIFRDKLLTNFYCGYMNSTFAKLTLNLEKEKGRTLTTFFYLLDKGYLEITQNGAHNIEFRLTAEGIDYVEKYLLYK